MWRSSKDFRSLHSNKTASSEKNQHFLVVLILQYKRCTLDVQAWPEAAHCVGLHTVRHPTRRVQGDGSRTIHAWHSSRAQLYNWTLAASSPIVNCPWDPSPPSTVLLLSRWLTANAQDAYCATYARLALGSSFLREDLGDCMIVDVASQPVSQHLCYMRCSLRDNSASAPERDSYIQDLPSVILYAS